MISSVVITLTCFALAACFTVNGSGNDRSATDDDEQLPITDYDEAETMKINISVNGYTLTATLEDNVAARAFAEMIASDGLSLSLSEYGGFEKVGSLGKSLPHSDERITTSSGDLILYSGSEFSLMYGSNTWSYTKLGAIDDTETINLKQILGSGNVTVKITIR